MLAFSFSGETWNLINFIKISISYWLDNIFWGELTYIYHWSFHSGSSTLASLSSPPSVSASVSRSAFLSPSEHRPLPYRRGYVSLSPSSHTFPASLTERETVFSQMQFTEPWSGTPWAGSVIHPLPNQPQEQRKWRQRVQSEEIHHTVIWAERVQYKFLKL